MRRVRYLEPGADQSISAVDHFLIEREGFMYQIWLGFILFILFVLILNTNALHRRPKDPSLKAPMAVSGLRNGLRLLFDIGAYLCKPFDSDHLIETLRHNVR